MDCKDCTVEVCNNNMPHPQKIAEGSLCDRNRQIIRDRAECICETCNQMQWTTCEFGKTDYRCYQLISKFAEHDGSYSYKSEMLNGKKIFYIRVAGIKIPESVLTHYVNVILDRMVELGIGLVGVKDELNVCGRLEKQRAECHRMVLQSIGFNGFIRTPESNILSAVLDNYIELKAKKIDINSWIRERIKSRG